MKLRSWRRRLPLCTTLALLASAPSPAAEPTRSPDTVAFFESKVRPILVAHCLGCHSAAKAKGGLRLDARAEWAKGGNSGPVIVPGSPDASLLVRAVRHADPDLTMPPKEKLAPDQIAALEAWVRMGAPDPRDGTQGPPPTSPAHGHWAFKPIRAPTPPAVRNPGWVRDPIDTFVLAQLEARGLTPSPPADRRTLLRRVSYDLIGLPPTFEEVRAFEQDDAPDAYAKVVDRLLASPQYGERWGRHWLDVARYADTKDGVLMYGDDRVRPYAYTYRDYVIRAFNEDRPFDRFVHEQLAADRIDPPVPPDRLAAMGFLTLGRMFDGNVHDVIDDQIDVVTRGLLGLTVSCARCHDHKYDPIPTADYYSLYGVFAGSEAPPVPPKLDPKAAGPAKFETEFAAKEKDLRDTLDRQYTLLSEAARARAGDYLAHVATTPPDPLETAIFFLSLAPDDLRPPIVARWRVFLRQRATPTDPVFGPWHDLFALPDAAFVKDAPAVVARWKKRGAANPLVRRVLAWSALKTKADVARAYARLLRRVYDESKGLHGPPDSARHELLEIVTGPDSPAYFPKRLTRRYMSRADTDAYGKKVQDLDKLAVKEPSAPARAMCLADSTDLDPPKVFVRGNPSVPGRAVPRQFLEVLSPGGRTPFADGSGRLDLARAITAPDNPLTARVIANRVWMHHFGDPLAESPSDFGVRTPQPVYRDLLDHLASSLRRDGWSLKRLHRAVVLSSTYRQASFDRPECRQVDPNNHLLWRANRRRLDLESMRDGMLAVSGRLDLTMFGRPVDAAGDPANRRRTVYGLVDRQSVPGVFRAFDFASPDQSAERRTQTTVPQQALFAMNSPFVIGQAKALATRKKMTGAHSITDKVRALYRLTLQRDPDADELRIGAGYVWAAARGSPTLPAWEQFAQVLLLTNEATFVD